MPGVGEAAEDNVAVVGARGVAGVCEEVQGAGATDMAIAVASARGAVGGIGTLSMDERRAL